MELSEIFENQTLDESHYLIWLKGAFHVSADPSSVEINRETLARVYLACIKQIPFDNPIQANKIVRSLWIEAVPIQRHKSLPRIISEDGFLRLYAQGKPLSLSLFRRIWRRLKTAEERFIQLNPINIEWNEHADRFFDIDATPPGILPKLFKASRLKEDALLMEKIRIDLTRVAEVEDHNRRRYLTLALLSHGAAYRELQESVLYLPNFDKQGELIAYNCEQHLIAEGLKTVSLFPTVEHMPGIYLCQGTELWPSQPSVLGSILSNFSLHGAATDAYAHSWRRIHMHLRELKQNQKLPIVAGHSMGGALAIQIALYSHDLIEMGYAFNPPVPNERDWKFYRRLPQVIQNKIQVAANLDDFAFWRIGAKIIGQVSLYMGRRRWRYYHVTIWDCILFVPAFIKFILNVRHAFPAHQRILLLSKLCLSVKLTPEEIERENRERTSRFDYMRFFPKLYDPWKILLTWVRTFFGWKLKEEYLRNEIEIITLHEKDLYDTMTDENQMEHEKELEILRKQKAALQRKL